MTHWATGGGVKVERAKQHIADLEGQSGSFLQTAPYTLVGEYDAETRETVYRWRPTTPPRNIPPIWGAIAGDAIHNLRSALDVLWRQATDPRPGKTDRRRGAHFPFPDKAQELEIRLIRVRQPTLKAALHIVKEFKPYQSGNEDLWLLNEASIADKHEVPVVVASTLQRVKFTVSPPTHWGSTDFVLEEVARATKVVLVEDGTEFVRTAYGQRLDLDEDSQPTFGIAFGEGGPLKGRAVLATLREFARITDVIAERFLCGGLVR